MVEQMVEGRLGAIRPSRTRIAVMRPVVGDVAQLDAGGPDGRVERRETKPAQALMPEHSRVEHSAVGRDEHKVAWLHVSGHLTRRPLMLSAAGCPARMPA